MRPLSRKELILKIFMPALATALIPLFNWTIVFVIFGIPSLIIGSSDNTQIISETFHKYLNSSIKIFLIYGSIRAVVCSVGEWCRRNNPCENNDHQANDNENEDEKGA